MTLLAPLWLLLLVPWAAMWAWAGRGGDTTGVPFLLLWPSSAATRGPRRRRPPLWAILLLLAAGMAIVAAAGPARVVPATAWTLVIDNGPAMTPARLRDALSRLPIDRNARVRVVPSVGEPFEPFEAVGTVDAGRLSRSALADEEALRYAARRAGGTAVVVTDHALAGLPEGMAVVTPSAPLANAGIDRFAVATFLAAANSSNTGVRAQAMVRIVNDTPRARARLQIDSVDQTIDLPARGTSRNYFIDLPVPGDFGVATLLDENGRPFGDDIAADDRAYLAKTRRTPRIEPTGPLPSALGRLLAIYANHRPPDAGGGTVTLGLALTDGPGVRLATTFAAATATATTRPADGPLAIDASHPVTRAADLRDLVSAPRTGGGPAEDGGGAWRVLARDGDDVLLAVRESPARQVWVGVDTAAIATSPAFVVLWTDLLDWAGGGTAMWASGPWHDGWQNGLTAATVADASLAGGPGVYRDGERAVAVAMPAVRAGQPVAAGAIPAAVTKEIVSVAAWVLLGALGLMVCGLFVFRQNAHFRSRLTN